MNIALFRYLLDTYFVLFYKEGFITKLHRSCDLMQCYTQIVICEVNSSICVNNILTFYLSSSIKYDFQLGN